MGGFQGWYDSEMSVGGIGVYLEELLSRSSQDDGLFIGHEGLKRTLLKRLPANILTICSSFPSGVLGRMGQSFDSRGKLCTSRDSQDAEGYGFCIFTFNSKGYSLIASAVAQCSAVHGRKCTMTSEWAGWSSGGRDKKIKETIFPSCSENYYRLVSAWSLYIK